MKLIKDLGTMFPTKNSKKKKRFGLYECPVCFKLLKVDTNSVNNKTSTKCGSCARRNHACSEHPLYNVWYKQIKRCRDIKSKEYAEYGARGINFSSEFLDIKIWIQYVESLEDAYY